MTERSHQEGAHTTRREVGVHSELPLALVARSMLSSAVDSVLVFDTSPARHEVVGRLTWRELVRAVAVGADPEIATAADFMVAPSLVDVSLWGPQRGLRGRPAAG